VDKNPGRFLSIMKKKNKIIQDEVSTILSSQSVNALRPLGVLSKAIISNPNVSLTYFTSDGFNVSAEFSSEDPNELESLQRVLKGVGLPALKTKYAQGSKNLTLEFEDR
jgi:hypothetical protein